MADPPQRQKQSQQQAIKSSLLFDPASFDLPPTTFAILKRRFYAHTFGVSNHALLTRFLIGKQKPRLFAPILPACTDKRIDRFVLPHPGSAIPLLPHFMYEGIQTAPGTPLVFHLALTRVFFADAQEIMPMPSATNPHERFTS
ncbi:hypothetical protein KSB_09870 [Ktedonobacter robiniae]|uniref:Uncharacterized protein n=1 Tax=Ktedonobacter robiniae TaxID=2778365 RepID=A0ABQ3UJC6_9CHLR|nr:hypothetical protein KSB_09870 [Ktedonobacter robiniae]